MVKDNENTILLGRSISNCSDYSDLNDGNFHDNMGSNITRSQHIIMLSSRLAGLAPSDAAQTHPRGHHHQQQHHSLVGILLITLGSFCFSCMFLFVKFMKGKANSFVMAFYRALVEIPIAVTLILVFRKRHTQRTQKQTISNSGDHNSHPQQQEEEQQDDLEEISALSALLGPPSARAWLWVRGGVGAAAVLCFFYAIQKLPLPDAVTIQFTTPPFAAAFAVCLAGEKWSVLDRWGAVVCLMGVMLIAHPSWLFGGSSSSETTTQQDMGAIAVALLGAAFAGLAYVAVRMIGHGASANVMVLYYSCLSLPITLVGSKALIGEWNVWGGGLHGSFAWIDWCWMLLTGIFAYLGQYLVNLGLQHESAATGTLATCTQIVFTYIFELLFLHEPINVWSVAGTILIIGFMTMVGLHKMTKQSSSRKDNGDGDDHDDDDDLNNIEAMTIHEETVPTSSDGETELHEA
mmetsp:Transcript_23243/g.40910  ORF Transcript_23243/g.40910 Transcript_23243/m.40910 type:complete len:462 (-) Transcript_23243:1288-2673(-)